MFYTLWYNKTMQPIPLLKSPVLPNPKNAELIFLQESIDNSILEYLSERDGEREKISLPPPEIKSTYSDFPSAVDRTFKNMGMESFMSAYFLQLGPLLTFIILL